MENIKSAHRHSERNKKALASAERCGCFYCCAIFSPVAIKEWVEEEDTALCPHCSIDSVIPELPLLPLSTEFLEEMCELWFG